MFFLLRMAFWLVVVLALLPSGGTQPQVQASKVDATDAIVAAGAAVSDMSNFCDRQPEACVVGAQTAVAIGQRAQAGAIMVYDFIQERVSRGTTGSVGEAKPTATAVADSQSTLKPEDLDPAWRGTIPPRKENVPLPRPRAKHPA